MHEAYGGVVPELASRDHIRRLIPLTRRYWKKGKVGPAGHRLHRRPGARRRPAGGRFLRARPRPGAGHPGNRRASPRRPHAVAADFRHATGISVRRAAGVGRPYPVDAGGKASVATACWAKRWTTRRARSSTPWRNCSAWATPAAPRCRSWQPAATSTVTPPRPMLAFRRYSRFQLFRTQDRRPDCWCEKSGRPSHADLRAPFQTARSMCWLRRVCRSG